MNRRPEQPNDPNRNECRHAVLSLAMRRRDDGSEYMGYVIYDRQESRIVDGTYFDIETALDVAAFMNAELQHFHGGPPNGAALGLIYPAKDRPY